MAEMQDGPAIDDEEEASPRASPDLEDGQAAQAAAEELEIAVEDPTVEPEPAGAPDAAVADEPAESLESPLGPGADEADTETAAAIVTEAGAVQKGAATDNGVATDHGGEGEVGGEDDAGEAAEAASNDVETGRAAVTETVPDGSVDSEDAAAGESPQGDESGQLSEAATLSHEVAGVHDSDANEARDSGGAAVSEDASTEDADVPSDRIDQLKAKAASGEELIDAELAQMQVCAGLGVSGGALRTCPGGMHG
jgi:hypothetical protein